MTISIKIKVLIKFEASDMMGVELKGKNLRKVYHLPKYTSTMSTVNKTISIKTKVLIKFEASEMCVELSALILTLKVPSSCKTYILP